MRKCRTFRLAISHPVLFWTCSSKPKFAEPDHRPLSMLYGMFERAASPNCRTERADVPYTGLQATLACFVIFGLPLIGPFL